MAVLQAGLTPENSEEVLSTRPNLRRSARTNRVGGMKGSVSIAPFYPSSPPERLTRTGRPAYPVRFSGNKTAREEGTTAAIIPYVCKPLRNGFTAGGKVTFKGIRYLATCHPRCLFTALLVLFVWLYSAQLWSWLQMRFVAMMDWFVERYGPSLAFSVAKRVLDSLRPQIKDLVDTAVHQSTDILGENMQDFIRESIQTNPHLTIDDVTNAVRAVAYEERATTQVTNALVGAAAGAAKMIGNWVPGHKRIQYD